MGYSTHRRELLFGCWIIISGLPGCCRGIPCKMDSADVGGWVGTGAANIQQMADPNSGKRITEYSVHTTAT